MRLAVLAGLSPLLVLSTCYQRPAPDPARRIAFAQLQVPQPQGWPSGLTLEGVWHLSSPNEAFGSYSALIADGGRLIAYSDQGRMLGLAFSGAAITSARMAGVATDPDYWGDYRDIESATFDGDSGTVWLGFERMQGFRRFRPDAPPRTVRPEAMEEWPDNGGPEAMTRLADGRFIVMAERDATLSRDPGEGLLFPRDPVLGDDPVHFRLVTGGGFQPTDMAALPDGRVLILLRSLDMAWPPFRSRLIIADPRDIGAGEPWPWTFLADIDQPQLRENYEGVAVAPRAGGGVTIWLMSDDNATQMQRTLLLKLAWLPDRDAGQ